MKYILQPKILMRSFGYAFAGVRHALEYNQNLRIDFLVAMLIMLASIFFHIGAFEMGILGVMILLVIIAEMVNTAIEEMVNLITTEHRREAKIAKDVSAGMVLIAVLGSLVVGILIFIPHILRLFQ